MSDWKNAHTNQAVKFADHRFVDEALTEYAGNMGFERKGLPEYGLRKIVRYVATVVLARARNFEPELLTMTSEEASEQQRELMRLLQEAGVPTFVVVVPDGVVQG